MVWLILLLGFVTTAFGITYAAATSEHGASVTDQIVAGVCLSLGSGVVGAAISLIVASISSRDTVHEIRDVIAFSLQRHLTSDEADLRLMRKEWHHYYVTEMAGTLVWRYQRYPFNRSAAVGAIVVEAPIKDPEGKEHSYRTEVGVRGSRVIVIDTRTAGSEQPSIHVYPHLTEGYSSTHCGMAFMVTWDGHHMVTKAILSQTRLIPGIGEGKVPPSYNAELEAAWQTGFHSQNRLLPTC